MSLLKALNWRYATKRMTGQKVPTEKIDTILEAIRLSASSMGLQPYTILVVEDEHLQEQIQRVAYNQPQIVEASHLLVFAAWSTITAPQIEAYINNTAAVRGVSPDTLTDFKNKLLDLVTNQNTPEQNFQWAARQAYIAVGTALAAAAEEEVDATPMEGFDAAALDLLLNLKERGLRSVTLLPLGYRDPEKDWLVNQKKVRRQKEQLFLQVA